MVEQNKVKQYKVLTAVELARRVPEGTNLNVAIEHLTELVGAEAPDYVSVLLDYHTGHLLHCLLVSHGLRYNYTGGAGASWVAHAMEGVVELSSPEYGEHYLAWHAGRFDQVDLNVFE